MMSQERPQACYGQQGRAPVHAARSALAEGLLTHPPAGSSTLWAPRFSCLVLPLPSRLSGSPRFQVQVQTALLIHPNPRAG